MAELKVFVDLDGVLVDFMVSVHQWYNLPYSYEDYPYEIGSWDCMPPSTFEGSVEEFWQSLPLSFWSSLSWTPDGKEILAEIERHVPQDQIYLFTARNMPQSASGAVAWVRKNLPQYQKRLLIGSDKASCAHGDALLIDDANHNIDAFVSAGGLGLLVPRKWNRKNKEDGTAVEKLRESLTILGDSIAGLC